MPIPIPNADSANFLACAAGGSFILERVVALAELVDYVLGLLVMR